MSFIMVLVSIRRMRMYMTYAYSLLYNYVCMLVRYDYVVMHSSGYMV